MGKHLWIARGKRWICSFCGQIEGQESPTCPKAPPDSAPARQAASVSREQFPIGVDTRNWKSRVEVYFRKD